MQWHVAMLATLLLGWCGSSMMSPIDNDRALPLNVWNLQPLELQWEMESTSEPLQNSRLSTFYDSSWPVDVKVAKILRIFHSSYYYYITWMNMVERAKFEICCTISYRRHSLVNCNETLWLFKPDLIGRLQGNGRWKRGEPNLSIMAPLDVLRHRLWQEMRRRAEMQIKENKKMMESVGKRKKRNSSLSDPALSQHLINQWATIKTTHQWLIGMGIFDLFSFHKMNVSDSA